MSKVLISCMDRRLNNYIESKYSDFFVFRNAGANVYGIEQQLKEFVNDHNVDKLVIAPHTDCGAMKVVKSSLEGKQRDSDIDNLLTNHFLSFKDSNLEEKNKEIMFNRLNELFNYLDIEVDFIDINKIETKEDKNEHILLVTSPYKPIYKEIFNELNLEPFGTYIIQARTDLVLTDIKIGIERLGIKNIIFLALKDENERNLKYFESMLRIRYKDIKTKIEKIKL